MNAFAWWYLVCSFALGVVVACLRLLCLARFDYPRITRWSRAEDAIAIATGVVLLLWIAAGLGWI